MNAPLAPASAAAPSRSRRWARLSMMLPAVLGCAPSQQVASLGDVPLQSGEVLRDCRVAYRTFGRLDAARSNAVLVIPWFLGTTGQLARQIGPGKLVDSSRWFVVAVDPLGNGASSSPSTSRLQPGGAFPRFTMADQVEVQRRLLEQVLGIHHLRAVVGISMGGMLTFEWITTHPAFMDAAIPIVATPRFEAAAAERWRAGMADLRDVPAWRRALRHLLDGGPRAAVHEWRLRPLDHARQAEAMIAHDVSSRYRGSLEEAAAAVRARLLVVVSPTDADVAPEPARQFARRAGARLLELDGRCGHQAPACERHVLSRAVEDFLGEGGSGVPAGRP